MLWDEFKAGTGCRDTEYNYNVYKDLEIIYMNADKTKAEIYEMGRKLVDNSKSAEQLRFEEDIKSQIRAAREEIESNKTWIDYYTEMSKLWELENDRERAKDNKRMAKVYKQENKRLRGRIKGLKWCLEG